MFPLASFTDEELEAELQLRRDKKYKIWQAATKCCYCYKTMDSPDPCNKNPWSDFCVPEKDWTSNTW